MNTGFDYNSFLAGLPAALPSACLERRTAHSLYWPGQLEIVKKLEIGFTSLVLMLHLCLVYSSRLSLGFFGATSQSEPEKCSVS